MNRSFKLISDQPVKEETDYWNKQPHYMKIFIKLCIVVELGWYVGWIFHVIHLL